MKTVVRIQITFKDSGSRLLRLEAKITELDGTEAEQVKVRQRFI